MEEAKNKENKQPEKTDEKAKDKEKGQQPSGKDKDKKEEQELVKCRVLYVLGSVTLLFRLSHCRCDNMAVQAEETDIQDKTTNQLSFTSWLFLT